MEARGQGRVVAWVDASAGLSGDMLLGALLDLGAELEAVQESVDAVLPGTVRIGLSETTRDGLRAATAQVDLDAGHEPHRRWSELRELVTGAALPERTRARALAVFEALARAEAAGVGPDEVGSWGTVAHVVAVCAGLEDLGVDEVVVSRIALGRGQVDGSHGGLSAPAVTELVRGWQVAAGGEGALATSTGVALATALASGQGPVPDMQLIATGAGAGARDGGDTAHVTRVVLGLKVPPATG